MEKKNDITRSLVIDKKTWNDAKKYARGNYDKSLSKVIDSLLREWVATEKRKGFNNPNQGKLIA